MAYLGDPRENRVGPNGELWEMDNRVEKRYYWNGQYMDLCGMEPEEAMKRVFNVKVVGEDFDKSTNKVTVSMGTNASGKNTIKVSSTSTVTSDITVVADYTIVDGDGKTVTGKVAITIPKGSSEGSAVIDGVDSIKSVKIDTKIGSSESTATGKTFSDNNYNYTVSDYVKEETEMIQLYWGIYPYKNDLTKISVNDLDGKANQAAYNEYPVDMVIPIADKEYDSLQDAIDASYRIVFALPEKYINSISIIDKSSINIDVRETFDVIEHSEMEIRFLVRTGENTELSPTDKEIPLNYLITIK